MNLTAPVDNEFVRLLAVLMSWRLVPEYEAKVAVKFGAEDQGHIYRIVADPMFLRYHLSDDSGHEVERYDGVERLIYRGNEVEEIGPTALTSEHLAARLAFPLSLFVWGRSVDDWFFSGSTQTDGQLMHAELIHVDDSNLRGTLTVSVPRRRVLSLSTPAMSISYLEIDGHLVGS